MVKLKGSAADRIGTPTQPFLEYSPHTMSVNLSTENIQTTISQLNRDFAGRFGSAGYDETKRLHIHRRNRPFVWNDSMQRNLLDSILKGYYIPPIICSSRIVGTAERREVMEGGNRITSFRRILDNKVRVLSEDDRRTVEGYPITLVVMRSLTADQQRVMFRRLNKNVKVSDGQLFAMSEEDSPLIREAFAFLDDETYPLRETITRHFFNTVKADNDGQKNLENAMALVSGAIYGPHFITKSFNMQEEKVALQEPINRNLVVQTLGSVFEVFDRADSLALLTDKRKRRGQWSVGKWLGAILYDIQTNPGETGRVKDKWARYIARVRMNNFPDAEDACKMGGAQNLTATRHKKVCKKVEIYMNDGRLASELELSKYVHEDPLRETEEDDASTNDEEEDEA